MAIFQTDVMICTTAYVKADNAVEAFERLQAYHCGGVNFRNQVLNGIEVSAAPLDAEDFPDICLSPYMTFMMQSPTGEPRTPADFSETE